MSKKKFHAVILARGGSKGIKNKNLVLVNNKPLIYWSIKNCLKTKEISSVWVSSDNKKILSYAKKTGANIILRPKKLSLDHSSSESGWLHAINKIKESELIDHVVALQATSPIRYKNDLSNAIKLYLKKKNDSLFSAGIIKTTFTWKKNKNKITPNYNIKIKRARRQSLKPLILENGSFYIFNANKFLIKKKRLFGKINYYTQKIINNFEIDSHEDLLLVRLLMSSIPKKFF
jgi:CMP-N,N'-diacetyllegionaminic acid synthase